MTKKGKNNKIKFNIYRIYLLIGIFFIGLQLANNSDNGKKTNWLHIYVKDSLLPSAREAAEVISLLNKHNQNKINRLKIMR